MLNELQGLAIAEIIENDRQVDVEETITGLNMAGFLLTRIAKEGPEGERDLAIDGLGAVISAMTYVYLMNITVESIKNSKGE